MSAQSRRDAAGSAEIAADLETIRYRPSELEAIARLLLRDRPVRLVAGEWWAYAPDSGTLVYPAHLLHEWTGLRAIGALCHEVAEALYAGPDAGKAIARFVADAARFGIQQPTALLLLNVVNDFRVNARYLAEFPGASPFLRALYVNGADLHPKNDVRGRRDAERPLSHHVFLDALISRWVHARWDGVDRPDAASGTSAVAGVWEDISRAAQSEGLTGLVDRLIRVLPVYGELVQRSREEIEEEARRARPDDPDAGERPIEPHHSDDDETEDDDSRTAEADPDRAADAGVLFFVRDDAPVGGPTPDEIDEPRPRPPPTSAATGSPAEALPRTGFDTGPRWAGGVIQRIRKFRQKGGVDYDQFDYVKKVRELEPLIDATVEGHGGAPGLRHILTLRRFGTADPFRRPRRFRRGETGELDEDRPENLLIDPAVAFLKGVRQQRQDSLKDFANGIMLDVSGSVVQRGYPSRKFDQVVETAVLFIEIHERLKLPYEVIAFSEEPKVMRSFAETAHDSMRLDPHSSYLVKDFSYLVREMYALDHGETQEARAINLAVAGIESQPGLKTILMVTDGISSDRAALVDALVGVEERNGVRAPRERLGLLAFGVGLAEGEFKASYEPTVDGAPIACARGTLVPKIDALPGIVCHTVERRILHEGGE